MITAKKNKVDIAALTLPKEKAEDTAQHLVNLGIRAIWNFAHVDLDLSDKSVVVENVHLSDSLMQLSYNIVKNSSSTQRGDTMKDDEEFKKRWQTNRCRFLYLMRSGIGFLLCMVSRTKFMKRKTS